MCWQRKQLTAAWAIKKSTDMRTKNSKLLCCVPSYRAHHKRSLVKFYGLNDHPGSDCNVVVVEEEQGFVDGVHDMVFTWRDITPRQDGDRQQFCTVRGDKSDSRSQVGTFYVKNNQVNDPQESGYCSTVGITGTVPLLTHIAHTSVAQENVKEESGSLSSEDDIEEASDKSECHSLQGSNIIGHDHDGQYGSTSAKDAEASDTSHINSSDNIGQYLSEDDANIPTRSKRDGGLHQVEKYPSVSDDEAALGFPTPASLSTSEAYSQNILCIGTSSVTSGLSEASFLSPFHSCHYSSRSTQQHSPLHPSARHNPSLLHHGNNTEVVQSISYTTNSFRKPSSTTETGKEEPQHSATHHASTQGFPSPRRDLAAPATVATQHQHLSETVNIRDRLVSVGRDVTITTCAVPETSAGKKKDSLCLTVEAALLPAPMKAGLMLPSPARYVSVLGLMDTHTCTLTRTHRHTKGRRNMTWFGGGGAIRWQSQSGL